MLTDTIIEDARWTDPDLADLSERAGRAVLAHLGLDPDAFEIAVLGCDDTKIATLNADFRDKPTATNVLSWPEEDLSPDIAGTRPGAPRADGPMPCGLGDIAIAYDTCAREAAQQGKPMTDHVTHLLVHGVLHLLGYDHVRDLDATLMEETEVLILATMGIADPYEQE